jgi:hypothetical protein
VSLSDVYIPTIRSAYSAVGKYLDQSWEYINHSQPHRCGNWTEAAIFLFWEYIDGIFVAVQSALFDEQRLHILVRVRTGRGGPGKRVIYCLQIRFTNYNFFTIRKNAHIVKCNQVL